MLVPNVDGGKVLPDRPSSLPRNDLSEREGDQNPIPILGWKPFQILDVVEADAVPAPPPPRSFLASVGQVGQVGQR